MRIEYEPKLDFDDVLLRPKRSRLLSRKEVDLTREFIFPHSIIEYKGVPIIAANMDHTGTVEMADALAPFGVSVALHKHYDIETLLEIEDRPVPQKDDHPMPFYSMGIGKADMEKLCSLKDGFPSYINVDIANGYSEQFATFIKTLRELVGEDSVIMAGNVVTDDMTQELILAGADIVKVGIGPGSVCTTRRLTGVGYPQLSAIMECADAAHGLNGLICADGGCKVPGDVAKAFGAGADFVMLGGMLAGHQECAGTVVGVTYEVDIKPKCNWYNVEDSANNIYECANTDGELLAFAGNVLSTIFRRTLRGDSHDPQVIQKHPQAFRMVPNDSEGPRMQFYGMSSETAMNKYAGGVADYKASEGKTVEVPYKGPVVDTMREILGGVRSACTYVGAERLKDLSKCTTFVLVGRQLNNKFGE